MHCQSDALRRKGGEKNKRGRKTEGGKGKTEKGPHSSLSYTLTALFEFVGSKILLKMTKMT